MAKKVIFDKKNVLVTGGAGFIGSHLCDELLKTSKVICLDDFSTGSERNIDHLLSDENFRFIKYDITQRIDLASFPELNDFKIEFQGLQEIYNLACPMSPRDFEKNKISTILANSAGTKNALDLALQYKAKFIHFSSSVVYGPRRTENEKIKEDDVGYVDFLSERSSYDEGKRFAETIVANYRQIHNLDTKVMRVFRIYGPRMKLNDQQMIPDFINAALEDREIIIYGDEHFSSSFCYISDLIDATLKMMESNLSGPINIGSDVEVNLSDFARLVMDMVKSRSNIAYTDKILFMTPLCLPDISQARNELGWMPVVDLAKGLKKTIEDLRANKGLLELKAKK